MNWAWVFGTLHINTNKWAKSNDTLYIPLRLSSVDKWSLALSRPSMDRPACNHCKMCGSQSWANFFTLMTRLHFECIPGHDYWSKHQQKQQHYSLGRIIIIQTQKEHRNTAPGPWLQRIDRLWDIKSFLISVIRPQTLNRTSQYTTATDSHTHKCAAVFCPRNPRDKAFS